MGAIICATQSQKCNQFILLPSPFSPNSPSAVIKAQTPQFLLLGRVLSVLFTALKNLLLSERAPSIPDHPRKFTASSLSTNKSAEWKGSADAVTEAVEKDSSRATNCLPCFGGATLTRLKPHIDFQPPWSLTAAVVLFLVFCLHLTS